MERTEANELLDRDGVSGVFLVRDSNTIKGDFVLCVKYGRYFLFLYINQSLNLTYFAGKIQEKAII